MVRTTFARVAVAVMAMAVAACGTKVATSPTSTSLTQTQATTVGSLIGVSTMTALALGALQYRPGATAAAGQVYGGSACLAGGRVDLVYLRSGAVPAPPIDMSAFKVAFASCAVTADFTIIGDLALSGVFTPGQRSDIRVTGPLSTSRGPCQVDATFDGLGGLTGQVCGFVVPR
jgi:hypothetical protein